MHSRWGATVTIKCLETFGRLSRRVVLNYRPLLQGRAQHTGRRSRNELLVSVEVRACCLRKVRSHLLQSACRLRKITHPLLGGKACVADSVIAFVVATDSGIEVLLAFEIHVVARAGGRNRTAPPVTPIALRTTPCGCFGGPHREHWN